MSWAGFSKAVTWCRGWGGSKGWGGIFSVFLTKWRLFSSYFNKVIFKTGVLKEAISPPIKNSLRENKAAAEFNWGHDSCLDGNVCFGRKIENDSQHHRDPLRFQAPSPHSDMGSSSPFPPSDIDILLPSHNKLHWKAGEMLLSVSLTVASQISLGK